MKEYIVPEIEVILLEDSDVITESGPWTPDETMDENKP